MKAHTHWLWQRVTAIIFTILLIALVPSYAMRLDYMLVHHKIAMFTVILISLIALWHSIFGIQAMFEDYIHSITLRKALLLFIKIIFTASYIVGLVSLLCLMVL